MGLPEIRFGSRYVIEPQREIQYLGFLIDGRLSFGRPGMKTRTAQMTLLSMIANW